MVWLEPAAVASWGKITPAEENASLVAATSAAVVFVQRKRPDLYVAAEDEEDPPVFTPDSDVVLGATMLATRLYERRGTSLGVAPSAGYEEAAQILRYDPDIESLLQIGRARPFGFGSPIDPPEDEEEAS